MSRTSFHVLSLAFNYPWLVKGPSFEHQEHMALLKSLDFKWQQFCISSDEHLSRSPRMSLSAAIAIATGVLSTGVVDDLARTTIETLRKLISYLGIWYLIPSHLASKVS